MDSKILKAKALLILLVLFVGGYGLIALYDWRNSTLSEQARAEQEELEQLQAMDKLQESSEPRVAETMPQSNSIVVPPPSPILSTRTAPTPANPRDTTMVEFEVKNGLAITQGDILIGQPMPGESIQRGVYEPPPVQYWDRPEIPYSIAEGLPNRLQVERAIQYFHEKTPVRFVPFNGQRDAIVFELGAENCISYVGKRGGHQPIKLAQGCGAAEIIHEIMHALGFIHEQSRADRDEHVEILWQNIDEKYHSQFSYAPGVWQDLYRDVAFDFQSAMLYRPDTFAREAGQVVLRSKRPDSPVAPVEFGLSAGDIARLTRMFPR